MNTVSRLLVVCLFAASSLGAFSKTAEAGIGFFATYVEVQGVAYDLTPPGGTRSSNPTDFDTFNFGTFNVGDSLTLTGAEALTFKNNSGDGNDVFGAEINYAVRPVGTAPAFTTVNLPFSANGTDFGGIVDAAGTPYTGNGDQQWSASLNVDLLSGLSAGMYEFEVFMRGTGNNSAGQFFHSNLGQNYVASFTVAEVPEPSSFIMFGCCVTLLSSRRRRKA